MNLFITDTDPYVAALHLDDNRVHKIALEATQILSAVLYWRGITGFYKLTHTGHPVTLWAAERPSHAAWTLRYGLALCDVYKLYGRKPEHDCEAVLRAMRRHIHYTGKEPAWFQNSARRAKQGIDFSHLPITQAYRKYLCARWPNDKRRPKWTGRPKPRWAKFQWQGEVEC